MAWNLTLQNASFRGVPFEVEAVEDRGDNALVLHEYPWRSGAEVENMGRKARVIPITALFWGVAYEAKLKALVAAFEEEGPGELIHPVFGSVSVAVRSWRIRHSAERHDYAELSFEAVEAATDAPFFGAESSRSLAEQALDAVTSGLEEALGLAGGELGKTLGRWAQEAARLKARVDLELQGVINVLDAGREAVRSVLSYTDTPSAFMADALAVVRGARADAQSASSSVLSAFSALSRALPLPSLTADEAARQYAVGANAYGPSWVSGPQSALAGRAEARRALRVPRPAPVSPEPPAAGSARTPRGQAVVYVILLCLRELADAAGTALKDDMAAPALTPNEIESLAGNVRARLDDALSYAAAALPSGAVHAVTNALRSAARGIQQLAEAALNARPPLATHVAEKACNFHALAHRLYGDFSRADELRRINPQVKNPNFIAKGQELLVYAR